MTIEIGNNLSGALSGACTSLFLTMVAVAAIWGIVRWHRK